MLSSIVPKVEMAAYTFERYDGVAAQASLAALAEQLRDGPLQELIELQRLASELADRAPSDSADRLRDLEHLVRLSLSTMAHFHGFTRDLGAVVRELTDAGSDH